MQLDELVGDVERDVQKRGPVGVARHLQLLHRREPVVGVCPELQRSG